ncbi:hypothetical protein [Algoriphagus sp. PAP.12]|uniref:hypothetical protein n=1 Tax=Algoriphagus sp. PAP.12 TaxID=2996678 RepID=UPI00227BBDE5|nr:hypothetical protein [Algoriphagus sp. PAP.12]
MNEIELIYAELIFSLLKSKWVYNEQILIDDIKSKAKIDGTPNIQEMKHLISFKQEMNIVKRNVFGSKTHVSLQWKH